MPFVIPFGNENLLMARLGPNSVSISYTPVAELLSATILIVAIKLFKVSSVTGSESESITVPGNGGVQELSPLLFAELQARKKQNDASMEEERMKFFIGCKNRLLWF